MSEGGWLKRVRLEGAQVVLVPLEASHTAPLCEAVRDGELWRLWYTRVPSPGEMEVEIGRRLRLEAEGTMLPFAVLEPASGRAVGMTTFMNADAVNRRVEIGSTWYAARVQRTGLNTEAKLLLLRHAFEALGCVAVEFRTHWMNHRSRRAIERLGAKLDGVLRNHMRMPNGTLRDTCVYSVIAGEWAAVEAHLAWEMDRERNGS